MITGKDFIITGLQPWSTSIGSNAKDIALELSKQNRVLYVNTPTRFLKKSKLTQIQSNLWTLDCPIPSVPLNFLPDGFLFDLVNKWGTKIVAWYIRKAASRLGFNDSILFIDNDIYRSFYMQDALKPSLSIYYRRDNMVSRYWKKHAPRLEPLLCKKSDLVVANSPQLADAVSSYNNHCHYIGQGVNLDSYDIHRNYPLPADMQEIPKPIVGYMGWITSLRLDVDLIYKIAVQLPRTSFVMVGGEDNYFLYHQLHTLPNVYFLGEKPQAETAAYIANFDVCINPQLVNEITIGNYPRKVDEYLALGKPVVATRTKTMEIFEEYVWNCSNVDEYITAIHHALASCDKQESKRRMAFAHSHTWENSVKMLYEAIEKCEKVSL